MASRSLGPFPKTLRWHEIVGPSRSDDSLCSALALLQKLEDDPDALKSVTFLVALVVCTRNTNPQQNLSECFGITLEAYPNLANLVGALHRYIPNPHLARTAAELTMTQLCSGEEDRLFDTDPWM